MAAIAFIVLWTHEAKLITTNAEEFQLIAQYARCPAMRYAPTRQMPFDLLLQGSIRVKEGCATKSFDDEEVPICTNRPYLLSISINHT